jgi:DNA polymerase-3 subunit delta
MAKGGCYLYLGPEIGEKQDAIEALRRKITGPKGGLVLEETSFYAGETPVTDMVSVLRNGSLFSDARLIFIKNAQVLKAPQKKEEVELLASYLESPQEDTTVILISEETSLDKRLEKAAGTDAKKIFWELFENRKTEWVAAFFKREGYRVTDEGIEAILDLVENNTDALRRECSRLMLFLGKDTPAGPEEVEKWLSHTREESAFTLFSRIAAGDLTRSIEILHTLLAAKEYPQSIIAGLTWCFRKFRDYLALTESGIPDDFEFKKIGLGSAKVRKDYAAAARRADGDPDRRLTPDRCLALAAEFDLLLRSMGAAPEGILMDLLVYKLIAALGGVATGRETWFYY